MSATLMVASSSRRVADESLERRVGALQHAVLGDADPEPGGLEHGLESILGRKGFLPRAVDLGEEDPQAKDDESSNSAVDRHGCEPVGASCAGEVLDRERGRHRQESDADEAKPSQRRGLDLSRRPWAPAFGGVNSGRRDQDVRGEPGGVRPGYGGRARPECRDVVDEVGDEHEDQRRSRQPDHGRTALAVEEQGREQPEQEDVSGRSTRDRRASSSSTPRPAPAETRSARARAARQA